MVSMLALQLRGPEFDPLLEQIIKQFVYLFLFLAENNKSEYNVWPKRDRKESKQWALAQVAYIGTLFRHI